jgi:glutathione S-transferase
MHFTRTEGLTPDKEVVDKHIADLSGKLDVYDKILKVPRRRCKTDSSG